MIEHTGKLKLPPFREPTDTELDQLWKRPYSRFAGRAGVFMAIGGYTLLMGYGVYTVLLDDENAPIPKIAVAAMAIGFLTALATVVFNRVRSYKNDKYRGIER
ncbi:MAG: hypothetical protein JXR23_02670 [Pontiellaceae bacterium]|nr:hypothetical protein [Pontiellaceae bacterium]